jgi:phosphomannomutase/phosphoglucomutase
LAVGYDCRVSNPELAEAFIEGVLSTGCDVTVLGMIFTPLLYFAVCKFGFDGGASITASHNPKQYNGVKLVAKEAHSICGDELQAVLKLIQDGDFEVGQGQRKTLDAFPAYIEKITSMVKLARPLKVAVDSGNGATGPYVQRFLEALGCQVTPLFTEPDGLFPNHEANPEEEENMADLAAAVKAGGLDLGLGFDGDGDRVGVVDETGKHYQADLLLLQVARDLLTRMPGAKIVFDVKVSRVLIDDIRAHGGEPVMAKTGHSFIEKTMHEQGAPLGGEISGHLFFAENYYGFDDAFLGAARLLEIASRSPAPFSQLFIDVPQTASTPEFKSPCPDDKKFAIVAALSKTFAAQYDCITIDGIRVNFDAQSWGAVRCSNTSPNLTLRFEAPNETRLKEIVNLMLVELEKYPEIDLWWAKRFK